MADAMAAILNLPIVLPSPVPHGFGAIHLDMTARDVGRQVEVALEYARKREIIS
jgi:hypothetical protein